MDRRYFTKPILPDNVETGSRHIRQWKLATGRSEQALYLVQPAAFFNVSDATAEDRPILLNGIISIALVYSDRRRDEIEKAFLCAALIANDAGDSSRVADCVRRCGVPVFYGDLSDNKQLDRFLNELQPLARHKASKPVINSAEYNLRCHTEWALGLRVKKQTRDRILTHPPEIQELIQEYFTKQKSRYRVYQEVALGGILCADRSHLSLLPGQLDKLNEFRCDLLIAAAPPSSVPMLVVEFDGPQHEAEKKARNDELRDYALVRSGVSVLRLSYQKDVDKEMRRSPKGQKAERNAWQCFEHIVRYVAEAIYLDEVEYPNRIRRCIEQLVEAKSIHRLTTESAKIELVSSVLTEQYNKIDSDSWDWILDYRKNNEERIWRMVVERSSGEHKFQIKKFQILKSEDGGVQGRAMLSDSKQKEYSFETPRVFAELKIAARIGGLAAETVDIVENCVARALKDLIDDGIKLFVAQK